MPRKGLIERKVYIMTSTAMAIQTTPARRAAAPLALVPAHADTARKAVTDWSAARKAAREKAEKDYMEGRTFSDVLRAPRFQYTYPTPEGAKTAEAVVDLRCYMTAEQKSALDHTCKQVAGFAAQVLAESAAEGAKRTRGAMAQECARLSDTLEFGVYLNRKDIVALCAVVMSYRKVKGKSAYDVTATRVWDSLYKAFQSRAAGHDVQALAGTGKGAACYGIK